MFRSLGRYAVVFAVVSSGLGAVRAEEKLTIIDVARPVGTLENSELKLSIDVDQTLEKPGQAAERHRFAVGMSESFSDETLAIEHGLRTRERRTYLGRKTESTLDDQRKTKDSPHPVKTIIAERRGGDLILTDDKGASLPPAVEPDEVSYFRSFGLPSAIGELLCGKPLTVGKAIPVSAEVARVLFGESAKFQRGTLTPVERRGALVLFRADLEVELPGPRGISLAIHYGGTLTYEKSYCGMGEMVLHGTTAVVAGSELAKDGIKVSGTGTSDFSAKITVTPPTVTVKHGGAADGGR